MKAIQDFDEIRHEYYFTYLANMAFMGVPDISKNNAFVVDKVNEKIKERIGKVHENQELSAFIKTIIIDEDIADEYLEIISRLSEGENITSYNYQWRYFDVSRTHVGTRQEGLFIKSIIPLGIKTGIQIFNGYKEAIYIDLFTATQMIDSKLAGIQGMMPVVNERRELALLNQKSLELTLFHHLKVDMKKIPVMINNLLEYDNTVPDNVKESLGKIKDYSLSITDQANRILTLFHKYVDIQGSFPPTSLIALKEKAEDIKRQFQEFLNFDVEFEPGLDYFSSTLFSDVFEFVARQFINNAVKEYESLDTPIEKRKIKITFSKSASFLKLSFYNSETTLTDPVLDNAGIRPLKSNSSGLGFYFLNYVLEMFRAVKPLSDKPRYFELQNNSGKDKGILMSIYFPVISTIK